MGYPLVIAYRDMRSAKSHMTSLQICKLRGSWIRPEYIVTRFTQTCIPSQHLLEEYLSERVDVVSASKVFDCLLDCTSKHILLS
jgi:hypothetical protein